MSIDEFARRVFAATPEPSVEQRDRVRARFEHRRRGAPAGRPKRMHSRAVGAVATAGGIAAIAGLLVAALPRGSEDAPTPSSRAVLPILDTPQTAADRLPTAVVKALTVFDGNLDPASFRLAREVGDRRFFVGLSRAGQRRGALRAKDALCLVDVRTGDTTRGSRLVGGLNCQELREGRRFIIASEIPKGQVNITVRLSDAPRGGLVSGIVPPGYATVSMGETADKPVNGVFVLRTDDLSQPIISDGPQGVIKLGLGIVREPALGRGKGPVLPLTVLSRGRNAADDLPARALTLRAWSTTMSDAQPSDSRYAGRAPDGRQFWLVPRTQQRDSVALVRVSAKGSLSETGLLLPRADLPVVVQVSTTFRGPFRNPTVFAFGLAADGYTQAAMGGKVTPIRDNFFVIRDIVGVGFVTLKVTGPAGAYVGNISTGFPQLRQPFVLKP